MDSEFALLMARAQEGEEAAAVAIWNACYDRLVCYARGKMKGMPRRSADEEDVVLSAMNSFFDGARVGRLAPKDANELWKLLATITVRKATAQLRKHHAGKRGGGKVRGDSAFDPSQVAAAGAGDYDLDTLSPHLGVACEEMLAQLDDACLRQVALLRLANHTNDEIALKLDCSVATVKRRVAEIRKQWATFQ